MAPKKNGLVAGNGIVNGSNGNNGNNHKDISVWGSWFGVFVALIIVFAIIAVATPPKGKISVDGITDDWNKVIESGEAKEFNNPVDDMYGAHYNMKKVTMYLDEKRETIYFGIQFEDSFGYAKKTPHTLHILIDADANEATGYFITYGGDTLGIDYWTELVLYNDTIQSNVIYSYNGNGTDWTWKSIGSGFGDKSDDGTFIELGYHIKDFAKDSKVVVITKIGYNEYPSPIYSLSSECAVVTKYQTGNTYHIKVTYVTKNPQIAYISFKVIGATLVENGEEVKSNMLMPSSGDKFLDGETRNITVNYELMATVDIENVASPPNNLITVIGDKFVGYKGGGINIDGNFDDWSSINKFEDNDKVEYANADITEYASFVVGDNAYVYVKVGGKAMEGAYIPKVYKVSGGGTGGGGIHKQNPGEDHMKINMHLADGSEKIVEIYGKYGKITKILLDGSHSKNADAAARGSEMEVGVYNLQSSLQYYEIEVKGLWCNIGDYASIRVVYIERSSYHTITVDGNMSDWDSSTELMGTQNGHSLYITWNQTHIFIGYTGVNWAGYGDLFIYFDSINNSGSNQSVDWNGVHNLPFYADYAFCVEDGNYYDLRAFRTDVSNPGWTKVWDNSLPAPGVETYIGWDGNTNTEIALPLSEIGITDPQNQSLSLLVYEQYEDSGNIYVYWPNSTSKASEFPQYYSYPSLSSGVIPNDTSYIQTVDEINILPVLVAIASIALWVRRID